MASKTLGEVTQDLAESLNSFFKLDVALPGTKNSSSDVKLWIPTKSTMINCLHGGENNYGIPVGRIIEVFGDFSHGKSTYAQHIMNAFQEANGISILGDAESGWAKDRAIAMGHNTSRHMSVEIETVESGFQILDVLLQNLNMRYGGKIPICFVWDTIAASCTLGEKSGDEYASGMMYKARLIRQQLSRLVRELPKNNCTLIFINQTIEGPKENKSGVKSTPGGGGIKFYSSQRVQIQRVGTFSGWGAEKSPIGIISQAKMVKNKLGSPMKRVDLPIQYDIGIDPMREVFNYLLDNSNIVNIAGAYKKIIGFTEKDISFYERDILKKFEENPGLLDYLKEQAKLTWFGSSKSSGDSE